MMRYFWSIFWAFLLCQMFVYVVGSMIGSAYNFNLGALLTVVISVMVYALSAILPNEPAEKH